MIEVPVVPPRSAPYTRVKTALVAGLALVALAWASHSDTALVTGAFSGVLSTSPAVRAPAAAAARTAQVDMALDRRSWLAALGGLAATAPWPAGASVLDPPAGLKNSKGAKKPAVKKPEAKKPEVKKPTPKPAPKNNKPAPAPKKVAPAPKKAPVKPRSRSKHGKKGGGLGGLVLPAAVIGGGYLLLNDEEGETSAPAAPAPAEDATESED